MLKTLFAVTKNIFTDVTKVDVQLTVVTVWISQSRIHQPELDILNVGFLKVCVVQFAHDTAPTVLRISELTIRVKLRSRHVVRTTLSRIER